MSGKKPAFCDVGEVSARIGTGYPKGLDEHCRLREKKPLGDVFGLSQFGVNQTTVPPGQWSALRHWHRNEDEFVYVLEGEVVLVNDDGEHELEAGMCAGFVAGEENGHHFVNRSNAPAVILEVGTRAASEQAVYPDDDLLAKKDGSGLAFTNRKGEPY